MPSQPAKPADDAARVTVSVNAGEFVFKQGDTGNELFIVQQGRVELLRTPANEGEPRQIEMLDVGDLFGEAVLLGAHVRETSARAETAAQLIRLDPDAIRQLIAEEPEIGVRLLRRLARRALERLEAEERALGTAAAEKARADSLAAAPRVKETRAPRPPVTGAPTLVHAETDTRIPLPRKLEVLVGRPDRSAGTVPDIDLSPFDAERTLSRQHARLVLTGAGVAVRVEAAARNGTFVNGRRVQPDTDLPLADGDRVRFGAVETVYRVL
jgi:CRP-like cAMP-binding protein